MDILQLAREHMSQPAPEEYRPTENAQVVFNYTFAAPAPVSLQQRQKGPQGLRGRGEGVEAAHVVGQARTVR